MCHQFETWARGENVPAAFSARFLSASKSVLEKESGKAHDRMPEGSLDTWLEDGGCKPCYHLMSGRKGLAWRPSLHKRTSYSGCYVSSIYDELNMASEIGNAIVHDRALTALRDMLPGRRDRDARRTATPGWAGRHA